MSQRTRAEETDPPQAPTGEPDGGAPAPDGPAPAPGSPSAPGSPPAGRSRTRGIVIGVTVLVAVLVVLGASLKVGGGGKLGEEPSGEAAPDFTLPLLDGGGELSLSDLRGKVVLLNFWASWCGPCKVEAPVLADGWKRWRSKGVVFLGVDVNDSKVWAKKFEREYGIEYQSVVDNTGAVETQYGVLGYPETFFIDAEGKIVSKFVGPMDAEALDQNLTAALAVSG